jgi:hypothetical protein
MGHGGEIKYHLNEGSSTTKSYLWHILDGALVGNIHSNPNE